MLLLKMKTHFLRKTYKNCLGQPTGGNCLGCSYLDGNYPGVIIRGAIIQAPILWGKFFWGPLSRGQLSGGNYPGGNCPGGIVLGDSIWPTISSPLIFQQNSYISNLKAKKYICIFSINELRGMNTWQWTVKTHHYIRTFYDLRVPLKCLSVVRM